MEQLIPIMIFLIPIIAIVMGVAIGMLALYLHYRRRKEMFTLYHQQRMAAMEKGLELPELPEAFFNEPVHTRSPHRPLLIGLILLFVGVALFISLYYQDVNTALFALIPGGIGLAYLIYYFAVGRKEALAVQAADRARTADASAETTSPA